MNSKQQKISAEIQNHGIKIQHTEKEMTVRFLGPPTPLRQVEIDGKLMEFGWHQDQEGLYHLQIQGETYCVELKSYYEEYFRKQQSKATTHQGFILKAPIPGRIIRIEVQVGDTVKKGQSLLVLSAMKLENVLSAPHEGCVKKIHVVVEESVAKNQLLLELE